MPPISLKDLPADVRMAGGLFLLQLDRKGARSLRARSIPSRVHGLGFATPSLGGPPMKVLSVLAGAAIVAGVIAGSQLLARAGDAPATGRVVKLGNATCPVKGTPVDAKVTTVWNDLEIGFCSSECPKHFASNPNAYTAALLRDLATQLADVKARLAKYEKPPVAATPPAPAAPPPTAAPALVDLGNAMCPVMPKMAAKPTVFVDYHGMRVHFCCRMCPPKFEANPQAYLNSLRSDPATAKRIDDAEAAWAAAHPRGR